MTRQQAEYAILHGTLYVGATLRYHGNPEDGQPPCDVKVTDIAPGEVRLAFPDGQTAHLDCDVNWSYYSLS